MYRVGIVGAGNVGSALLFHLAGQSQVEVVVATRTASSAEAALSDAISGHPEGWQRISTEPQLVGDFDIVVVTAGVQPQLHVPREELMDLNLAIARITTSGVSSARWVVLTATPVDRLTELYAKESELDPRTVIGFGGDLDVSRLGVALSRRHIYEQGYVIGEHGPNAIPVYEGEYLYEEVAAEVRSSLRRVLEGGGRARNLASGFHLARLIDSIIQGDGQHCISAYHEEYCCWLSWPYLIRGQRLLRQPVQLGSKSASDMNMLLAQRTKPSGTD